ncbi:MAG: hypothetical protein KC615_15975 [Anaerolineae bacterium]|nr:hypothetical protein [Anaerolineae bacterium]
MTEISSISRTSSIIKLIQDTLSVVLGFVGLTTGLGFVVVTVHLSRYGTVQGYTIAPGQYIAAGILVLIPALGVGVLSQFILILVTPNDINPISSDPKQLEQLLAICEFMDTNPIDSQGNKIVIDWIEFGYQIKERFPVLSNYPAWQSDLRLRLEATGSYEMAATELRNELQLQNYFDKKQRFFQFYRLGLIIVGIFVMIVLFVAFFYERIPFAIGGGSPEPIVIVFENDTVGSLLEIASRDEPRKSKTVLILAELVNGILVLDPDTSKVIAIEDEQIIARMSS